MVALPHPRRPRFLAESEPKPIAKASFLEDSSRESSLPLNNTNAPNNKTSSSASSQTAPFPSPTPATSGPPLEPATAEPAMVASNEPSTIPFERASLPSVAPASPPSAPIAVVPIEKLEALGSTIENLRLISEKLAEQARSDALEIAFQIAKRILESEVRANPEPLFKLIRAAIQRIGEARTITIRLSPEDASTFESNNGTTKVGASLAQVNVLADSSLERGDCVLDSDLGMVDGRLQHRLAELRRSVENAMEGDAA